jgi:hypothetical protein
MTLSIPVVPWNDCLKDRTPRVDMLKAGRLVMQFYTAWQVAETRTASRLLLASARMHPGPLRKDKDESDNERCENA